MSILQHISLSSSLLFERFFEVPNGERLNPKEVPRFRARNPILPEPLRSGPSVLERPQISRVNASYLSMHHQIHTTSAVVSLRIDYRYILYLLYHPV